MTQNETNTAAQILDKMGLKDDEQIRTDMKMDMV
jgi:hypothetical protein